MVPEHLLVNTVTVVRPAEVVDAYGNTTLDYKAPESRTEVAAWVQQDQRMLHHRDGRDPLDDRWLLVTNHDDIRDRDRIEWDSPTGTAVFTLDGPPEPTYAPLSGAGAVHHTEARLRRIQG